MLENNPKQRKSSRKKNLECAERIALDYDSEKEMNSQQVFFCQNSVFNPEFNFVHKKQSYDG